RRTHAAVRPPARPRLPTPARRCTTAAPGAGDPRRARTIGSNDSLRISIPDAASFGAEVDAAVQAGIACDVPHDAAKPHAVVIDATPAAAAVVGSEQARRTLDPTVHEQHRRRARVRRCPGPDRTRVIYARQAQELARRPV